MCGPPKASDSTGAPAFFAKVGAADCRTEGAFHGRGLRFAFTLGVTVAGVFYSADISGIVANVAASENAKRKGKNWKETDESKNGVHGMER